MAPNRPPVWWVAPCFSSREAIMGPIVSATMDESRTAMARVKPNSRNRRPVWPARKDKRSEEHTSELQSRLHLVCRLLLEKKKKEDNGGDHGRDGSVDAEV